jgi:Ca2+/Na+ antiporter
VGIMLLAIFVAYMILCVKQALAAKNDNDRSVRIDSTEGSSDIVRGGSADGNGDGEVIGLTETPVNPDDSRMTDDYVENVLRPQQNETKELALNIGRLILGAAVIAVGAHLLVDNGTLIAEAAGIPQSVIALTFVALGTSLPELVTAITALVKGHSDLSLGNVIGANLFNLVLVSGLAVTLAPFHIPVEKTIAGINASLVVDIPVMVAVMLIMCLPALIKGRIYRAQGVTLLSIYAAYVVFQFV